MHVSPMDLDDSDDVVNGNDNSSLGSFSDGLDGDFDGRRTQPEVA